MYPITEQEHPIKREHRIERALRTEVLCRIGNRRPLRTGHQASILHQPDPVHPMEEEADRWEEEVVHLEEEAEEGDDGNSNSAKKLRLVEVETNERKFLENDCSKLALIKKAFFSKGLNKNQFVILFIEFSRHQKYSYPSEQHIYHPSSETRPCSFPS